MGNQVVFSQKPLDISDVTALKRLAQSKQKSVDHVAYRSVISLWRLVAASKLGEIKMEPVVFPTAETLEFKPTDCYICLHLYRCGSSSNDSVTAPMDVDSTIEAKCRVSLLDTASVCLKNFTDGSIENIFAGWGSDLANMDGLVPGSDGNIAHDIYAWNGKNTHPLIKAAALTKSFELERWLMQDAYGVSQAIFTMSPTVPLTSIFIDDIPDIENAPDTVSATLVDLFQRHHLFRVLVQNRGKDFIAPELNAEPWLQSSSDGLQYDVLKKDFLSFLQAPHRSATDHSEPADEAPPAQVSPAQQQLQRVPVLPKVPSLRMPTSYDSRVSEGNRMVDDRAAEAYEEPPSPARGMNNE